MLLCTRHVLGPKSFNLLECLPLIIASFHRLLLRRRQTIPEPSQRSLSPLLQHPVARDAESIAADLEALQPLMPEEADLSRQLLEVVGSQVNGLQSLELLHTDVGESIVACQECREVREGFAKHGDGSCESDRRHVESVEFRGVEVSQELAERCEATVAELELL